MAELKHNGGIVDAVLELGFDQVKYFEGDIGSTATGFTIDPPARRLQLTNRSESEDVYFRVNGGTATTDVGFVPGDNIKLGPGCSFTMDYDILTEISLVTAGATVPVEGLLGWKGTRGNC
jgi:hypothetical protein